MGLGPLLGNGKTGLAKQSPEPNGNYNLIMPTPIN